MLAEAAGTPHHIPREYALQARDTVGSTMAGWFQFQPIYEVMVAEQPDLLD